MIEMVLRLPRDLHQAGGEQPGSDYLMRLFRGTDDGPIVTPGRSARFPCPTLEIGPCSPSAAIATTCLFQLLADAVGLLPL